MMLVRFDLELPNLVW